MKTVYSKYLKTVKFLITWYLWKLKLPKLYHYSNCAKTIIEIIQKPYFNIFVFRLNQRNIFDIINKKLIKDSSN